LRARVNGVTGRRATDIGRGVRWLLLAATVFGLAMMHTLGHAGMQMDASPHSDAPHAVSVMTGAQAPAVQPAVMFVAAAPCTDGHCGGGAMNGWSVCVAVLGGLAIVTILTALLVCRRRDPTVTPGEDASTPGTPRAPPRRRAGLTLATTTALRI